MQNAGDLDAFNIFAGERVELTPGALLGLQGPDGSLTGSLNVVTDGVLAAGSRSGIGAGFVNLFGDQSLSVANVEATAGIIFASDGKANFTGEVAVPRIFAASRVIHILPGEKYVPPCMPVIPQ